MTNDELETPKTKIGKQNKRVTKSSINSNNNVLIVIVCH